MEEIKEKEVWVWLRAWVSVVCVGVCGCWCVCGCARVGCVGVWFRVLARRVGAGCFFRCELFFTF